MAGWLQALETRHLQDLRFAEVTRALRALSSAYVERRAAGAVRNALDSAGKRAAFALFYGPLHFLTMSSVVQALDARISPTGHVIDIGCGTGVAGAAWALASGATPRVTGFDRHPWAVQEARHTYTLLGLNGRARAGDLPTQLRAGAGDGVVAAYLLNELTDQERRRMEDLLSRPAAAGARVLVLEPISRHAAPWWPATASRLQSVGFRADEWRLPIERPPIVRKLDQASGLDHRTVTVRTLYHPGA